MISSTASKSLVKVLNSWLKGRTPGVQKQLHWCAFFSGSPSITPQQLTWLLGGARVELGGRRPQMFSDIVFLLPKGTYQGGWEGMGGKATAGYSGDL